MKIAVNGNIIDTKHIYKITEIKNALYNSYAGPTDPHYLGYSFNIDFFNKRELIITISGDDLFPRKPNYAWNDWYKENYECKFQLMKEKIEKLRQSIIKIWLENQSEIPQFNL